MTKKAIQKADRPSRTKRKTVSKKDVNAIIKQMKSLAIEQKTAAVYEKELREKDKKIEMLQNKVKALEDTVRMQEKTIVKIKKAIDSQHEHQRVLKKFEGLLKSKKMQRKKEKEIRRAEKYESD